MIDVWGKTSTGQFRLPVSNYYQMTSDNTKNNIDIPLTVTQKCWERLHKLRLANSMFDDNGNENIFNSSLNILNPRRWIPTLVPAKDPIYPYESETFCVCQSQPKYQLFIGAGLCYKYTIKSIHHYIYFIKLVLCF